MNRETQYTTTSGTFYSHNPYTKKECIREVLHFAKKFVNAKWYNRKNYKDKLFIWVKLLELIERAENETR